MSLPDATGLGLDPVVLAGMLTRPRDKANQAIEAIRGHLAQHRGYVAWSGGKDSTATLDLALRADPQVPVCWFDSGLELPPNRAYIARLAETRQVNLHVIKAIPDALTVLMATGAWDHHASSPSMSAPDMHDTLIKEPSRQAHEMFGPGELWGLRAAESAGRKALLAPGKGVFHRADGTVPFSPVWDWRDTDIYGYLASRGVPENPVYEMLRAAGGSERDLRVGLAIDGNARRSRSARPCSSPFPDMWTDLLRALPRLAEWA